MIKLIATDIDGTLIQHGVHAIEKEVLAEMRRLKKKGILFAAASGRQYPNLWRLFKEEAQDMYFVAENGSAVLAPVYEKGMLEAEILHTSVIKRENAMALAHRFSNYPDAEILISGVFCCYILERAKPYQKLLEEDWDVTLKVIEKPEDIEEDIIKITAYTHKVASEVEKDIRKDFEKDFQIAVSGQNWLDFTVGNKALGLKALAKVLNIPMEEMMAFGDNYNDVEMLQSVGHPYLMENAAEPLKKQFPQHCKHVLDVLKKL